VASYAVDDATSGDGDGIPEPGEALRLMIEIENVGLASAASPSADLWTVDPFVDVTAGSVVLESIPAAGAAQAVFTVSVDPACGTPYFPELYLDTTTQDGFHSTDTLTVAVGTTGFDHSFEGGAPGWDHAGAADLWHLTTHRAHSGTTSWYAGAEGTWEYENNMDCRLDSPDFTIGVDTEISFWCRYEVPIYGVDGLYVELISGGTPIDTLDFIGSGGALGVLDGIGNDWLEYRYGLDATPGDTVAIRFRFSSDEGTVAEGAYIDDVSISTTVTPTETEVVDEADDRLPIVSLHQNCPNPFTPSTSVLFTMREGGAVHLAIYNIEGRLIRTLVDAYKAPGDHVVLWDAKDDLGSDVAAGVYLYRIAVGRSEETRKMILIR